MPNYKVEGKGDLVNEFGDAPLISECDPLFVCLTAQYQLHKTFCIY